MIELNIGTPLKRVKQELFCQAVARGEGQTEAYMSAFGVTNSNSTRVSAHNLSEKDYIKNRINELRLGSAVGTVLTIAEKRQFLAEIVRTPIGEIDANSALAQKYKATKDGLEVTMCDKLKALELDAKLSGELEAGVTINNNEARQIVVMLPSVIANPRPTKQIKFRDAE